MSVPLATIFNGDVTLEVGSDPTQFGYGDLKINRNCIISGTQDVFGSTGGSLSVAGGLSVSLTANFNRDRLNGNGNALNVLYGKTNLTETHIDTTLGPTTITGGNKVDISVGAASQFVCTDGNLTLNASTQTLQLYAGGNSSQAIDIKASNINGGIQVLSGNAGNINMIAGSGGLSGYTSSGNLTLTANNAQGSFIVNSVQNNQNLVLGLNGSTDSQVLISSSGTNPSGSTRTALVLKTTNTAGNIEISNSDGIGSGYLKQYVGSGGFELSTNTGGSINVYSRAASSTYSVISAGMNQNLSIQLTGDSDSTLLLESSGTNNTNEAIIIRNTHTSGNINLTQPNQSTGRIYSKTGTGGFITDASQGSIQMTTYSATSLYTNATTSDEQNLTVSVTGNTNSKVIIKSSGTGPGAITLQSTGGIYATSVGKLELQTQNLVDGIKIATENEGVPITIGTRTSITTINGDLYVKGTTTEVDQQIVTIDDNIILVNNAPYGTSDGGLAIKRYQHANNTGAGEVVNDIPELTGTALNGSVNTITLDSSASNINNYYNGWWVKITGGTGSGQVRRIKSYNGSTKVATIYNTADQTTLGDPTPVEGMDFLTYPDNTSTYELYPCHYVMAIWDESENEFALICTASSPSDPNKLSFEADIAHYTNLRLNNLKSNAITTNYINGGIADSITTVTLYNDSNYVELWNNTTLPLLPKYGIYLVFVKPITVTTRAYAIFIIGRVNVSITPGTVTRLMSVKGADGEHLDMRWSADSYPVIYYRPSPDPLSSPNPTVYQVKIVSL